MSLRTLLVCLTSPEHAETLMKVAVPLARKHDAHLIGLHTVEALVVYPGIAMHIPEKSFAAFNASQKKDSEAIKAVFKKHTQSEDFASEFRLIPAESVSAADRIIESARAADLVIMAAEDKTTDHYDQRAVQARVIRGSGRPVIVVPKDYKDYEGAEIGANIVLGWSDTREAARAAHDLLSVADAGANLTVLRVGETPKDMLEDPDGIDISEMFARHGIKTTLEHRGSAGGDIAKTLTKVAFEKGAGLIATGAFGHSKAYDFVIGATTYALLKDPKLPVLFSK